MVKNILLIDDSKLEYELFSEAAEFIGFDGTINCITDSRRVFHELFVHEKLPDLIVIDIRMPHINGHSLVHKLKNHPQYHSIFMVMFSSSDLTMDREKAYQCGADYFFHKPDEFKDYPLVMSQMLLMANDRHNQVA